jgi:hypothetical protein
MRTLLVLLVLVVAVPACGRIMGNKEPSSPEVDRKVADRVVERVLAALTEAHREEGPLAAFRLPRIKQDAAQSENFANWRDFHKRLLATDRSLSVEYSRRITKRLEDLSSEKPSGAEGG